MLKHKKRTSGNIIRGRQGLTRKNSGPDCKVLLRWKDRLAIPQELRGSLKKTSQPSHGSQIQRLWTRAHAVSRAVISAHGSTADRARGGTPRLDQSPPCKILRLWTCACGMQRRARRKDRLRSGTRRRLAGVASGQRCGPPN
jgi:hypothetical protein